MAKFYGKIGYASTVETKPGVYEEQIVERSYYGDLIRNTRRLQSADQVNDDINISNEISIVADPYATNNFHTMRYAVFMGTKWKISNVEVSYPRLILTLGGVYNGQ
jgi:hypothetical protein|nr:MAG TPA: hypothetical protein [Caudoviricetes sp.]DAT18485.1 MAG TPA: hypothetical protein [Caudoviricetes sp.]DAZ03466.1 MAG TPA: hypothetical protein [Caudoviricetes sp.]